MGAPARHPQKLPEHEASDAVPRPEYPRLSPYSDDVVEYFVQKSVANGIDIIRIFDALNDIKNLKVAINAAKKEKAHVQVAISYTTGPVFTTEYYVNYAKQIEEAGADSICLKDMAALLTPYRAYELVKAIKEAVSIPLQLHTHSTSGLASMCQLKRWKRGLIGSIQPFRRWRSVHPMPRRNLWLPPSAIHPTIPALT
jgi:pyruvate/oxaloacetate carboxyltransferase